MPGVDMRVEGLSESELPAATGTLELHLIDLTVRR